MAKSPKFTLKLLIDEKKNKVVLAEADQDFVDVLISLLTLPMGTIARRLENHKTVLGCYKNLNKSVADMVIDHFETKACRSMLLYPKSTKEIHCRRLKLNLGDTNNATRFYMCHNFFTTDSCTRAYSNFSTSKCTCGNLMNCEIQIPEEEQVGEVMDNADGVFVKCRSSFIVTDDLNVTVNSMGVVMKVLNDLGYRGFSDLQETLLNVGFEEVVNLLGCCFTSEDPLTGAFLRKHCMTKMYKMLSPPVPRPVRVVPSGVISVNVFVRKSDKEILYAECNEDFIDSLLTFLVLPLELACSLSNDNTILGCVGNLCRSPCRRASASNFFHLPDYYTCSNNNLLGSFSHGSRTYECLVPPPRDTYTSRRYSFARQIKRSLPSKSGKIVSVYPINPKEKFVNSLMISVTGFMKKDTKFIVSNDLVITPMNSSSTIGLLKKMHVDFSDLEEHQINITKAELISILRACLTSSSALTDGLSHLLLKKPKEET